MEKFNHRVFGGALIKAINSNYNADFSGQPRTLPNGVVYATDKVLKYAIRNYLKDAYDKERIFVFKSFTNDVKPRTLDENFINIFGDFPKKTISKEVEKKGKTEIKEDVVIDRLGIAKKLLTCIDIRFFGATYAGEENISIHGPVQINHGVNIWNENNIFSEQIMSPYRNSNESSSDSDASTLGRQSKLQEGHYLHHFSINPKTIEWYVKNGAPALSIEDIVKLKEAMSKGVTYYDSSAKAGCENELLVWVTLKQESKLVLPNFTQLMKMDKEKVDGKVQLDLSELKTVLEANTTEIESIEISLNQASIVIKNAPKNATIKSF